MSQPFLSVIVPCYNEAATLDAVLRQLACELKDFSHEVIVVDDGSADGSQGIAISCEIANLVVIGRELRGGKTAALRDGLTVARGDWVIFQDADLEYHPSQIVLMLDLCRADTSAVFGQRPNYWMRSERTLLTAGVWLIDQAIRFVYNMRIHDHATCYKLVRRELLNKMELESIGFEGCVEICGKLIRMGTPIQSVPIRYAPRTRKDGKKLRWTDGFGALAAVWRYRRWTPSNSSSTVRRELSDRAFVLFDNRGIVGESKQVSVSRTSRA